MKLTRVSIKPHLQPFFNALAAQMECSNPSEVLNHILMHLKLQGFSLLSEYQYKPAMSNDKPQSVYAPQQSQRDPLPQDDIPQNEDPYIRRLLEIGIEDF
ncbi:MAG: hypothetical protein KME55_34825 [Nostoc indistinguendum CM1-VF10]|jgi:hypothetical protein|nr:hypothetical protein [Nostoc indistinguendum CM1-VF10]